MLVVQLVPEKGCVSEIFIYLKISVQRAHAPTRICPKIWSEIILLSLERRMSSNSVGKHCVGILLLRLEKLYY